MQPRLQKLNLLADESIIVLDFESENFYDVWHFHPEYELFYVREGSGVRFVGDSINKYAEGDLVLLGPNLPHTWKNVVDENSEIELQNYGSGVVIQLPRELVEGSFFKIPEMYSVQKLLQKSCFGVCFSREITKKIVPRLNELKGLNSYKRVFETINIFHDLSLSGDYELLSNAGFIGTADLSESKRINKVFDYILENYKQVITLDEVSDIVSLTPTSFCRFFKKYTQKSFSRYLIEVRVSFACKLLTESNMTVTQICYESGFQNLSNFNRKFKEIMRMTPVVYRKAQV